MEILPLSFKNLKGKPNEDFYLVSEKYLIFTVADGSSRIKNKAGTYTEISGARLAAEEFCKAVTIYLEKNYKKADLKILKQALNFANRAIFKLNEKWGINKKLDYLENDYFSTCGVAGFIKGKILYFGYVGDCEVRIYNRDDFLKFISINDVLPLEEWRDGQNFKSKNEYWLIWRKILRNKSNAPYLTYGTFTGEPEVKYYYHLGKIKLQKGDLVFFYSDGFSHFIKKPKFRKLFKVRKGNQLLKEINKSIEKEIKSKLKTREGDEIFLDDKTLISILI